MYAIVECGGRQYRAEEGHSFSVEKLPYEVGEQIDLNNVLLLANGDDITIGQPTISGAQIKATVVDQYRGKKIIVWKYKPKKRYRRKQGHRQSYTRLRVDTISTNVVASAPAAEADDLTKVEGIGPKIAELLNAAGISTYRALSETTPEQIKAILSAAGGRYQTAVPDSWPQQAQLAADGSWDALTELQDKLDGGRYVDSSEDA
jgi:large subunit ribosomal protein L21